MGRLRALGYAALTTLVVFTYLALPLLRELYGPVVNFPVYAGMALFAGLIAYGIVRRVQAYAEQSEQRATNRNEVLVEGEVFKIGPDENGDGDGDDADGDSDDTEGPQVDVEVEMEQLKDDTSE